MPVARLKVVLVVRPQRAEVVCQRLLAAGFVDDLAAVECRGYGRQKGHLESYEGAEYTIDFLPKVLVTGLIDASQRDQLVDIVCATCRTGRIGDGKIFLLPVEAEVD
jgi:nitrogen regulatory protein P-II 1